MNYLLLLFAFLCINILIADAKNNSHTVQDSVIVYFRQGMSQFDPLYQSNGERMNLLISLIKHNAEHKGNDHHIHIIAGASPQGSLDCNQLLSEHRAENIAHYIRQHTGLDGQTISIQGMGVNWNLLTALVRDTDMVHKEEVIDILEHTPELIYNNGRPVDGRLRQLGMLHGGAPYRWLYCHLFELTRSASVTIAYTCSRPMPVTEYTGLFPIEYPHKSLYAPVPQLSVTPLHKERKKLYIALKTNLLYDAGLIPNIGGEIYLGSQWSIAGYYKHAWWKSDSRHWYWRTYGGEISVRRWLGRKAHAKPLTGHHLGLYGEAFTYDFETGGKGLLADRLSYAIGIEYGYSLPVARRLNLDFVVGAGYMGGEYKEYIPTDHCYAWQVTKRRHWIGPTKAEIALVWLIGHNNTNKRKGGEL